MCGNENNDTMLHYTVYFVSFVCFIFFCYFKLHVIAIRLKMQFFLVFQATPDEVNNHLYHQLIVPFLVVIQIELVKKFMVTILINGIFQTTQYDNVTMFITFKTENYSIVSK